MINFSSLILVNCATLLGGFGSLFLKIGSSRLKEIKFKEIFLNRSLILGLLIYVLSTFLFVPALHGANLSVVYPFVATSYLWAVLFSRIFLNETISRNKIFGLIFIILGVVVVGL